nr:MAG TPA: hypothetical protein [Caudoviricetes sp.]
MLQCHCKVQLHLTHNNYFFLYSLSKSFSLQRLRNHLS